MAVLVLALGLRLRAAQLLQVDYDEDNYLAAAQRYAQFVAAGDVRGMIDYAYCSEHPPLAKLAFGLAIAPLPQTPLLVEPPSGGPRVNKLPQPHMRVARAVAILFGTLEVLALASLNPVAGLFLAIQTWAIKYTSEIMLEALPSLTSLLAVLCYVQAKRRAISARNSAAKGWLLLSAVALGLTAASKYIYCVAGVAIAVDWMGSPWVSRTLRGVQADPKSTRRQTDLARRMGGLLLWGLIAAGVFLAANPYLWSDPMHRLAQSVLFHPGYAQSALVEEANEPVWKPLVWLVRSIAWPSEVFLVRLDTLIALLAAVGLTRLWRSQRVFALWLILGVGFLLVWPTKWPQYMKTVSAPLCLAAAEGFRGFVGEPLLRWWRQYRTQASTRLGSEQ